MDGVHGHGVGLGRGCVPFLGVTAGRAPPWLLFLTSWAHSLAGSRRESIFQPFSPTQPHAWVGHGQSQCAECLVLEEEGPGVHWGSHLLSVLTVLCSSLNYDSSLGVRFQKGPAGGAVSPSALSSCWGEF
ncbi:hypothetical protein mRhiFer1_010207 [Rhinolophus ferrumequinum]|uniref:Uncharacterized protein n=1 Tax=Rhinolophus ferrumequinum TaxID=59479 RepID=A0A7J7X561_RHIFE|nr:hypothetical protein mRhiFer1_010207 [Rhinolophus ferrumequinum]